MKKIAQLLILVIPLILISCFEFVGAGTSKRMLNLFLAAPGDVAKIHVAVFDGALTPDRVIYKESFAAGSSIPLELPAGNNRFIVVWGESFTGTGNYFGSIGPVTIQESDSSLLPIQMKRFDDELNSFQVRDIPLSPVNEVRWNFIPGAVTYSLDTGQTQITGGTSIVPFRRLGYIRVFTSVFDISSDAGYFNLT